MARAMQAASVGSVTDIRFPFTQIWINQFPDGSFRGVGTFMDFIACLQFLLAFSGPFWYHKSIDGFPRRSVILSMCRPGVAAPGRLSACVQVGHNYGLQMPQGS